MPYRWTQAPRALEVLSHVSCHTRRCRGVAKAETDGTVNVLLDDYPYAEDGLLIWNALKKWNDGYLVPCSSRLAKISPCCDVLRASSGRIGTA
jgi:hypothetical protein